MKKSFILALAISILGSTSAFAKHHGDVTIGRDVARDKVKLNLRTGKEHVTYHDPFTGEKIRENPYTGTTTIRNPFTGTKIKENPYRGTVTITDKWAGLKYHRSYRYSGPVYEYDYYRNLYGNRYREGFYDGLALGLVAGAGLVLDTRTVIAEDEWLDIRARYYDNYRMELLPGMVVFYPLEDSCLDAMYVRTPMGTYDYIGTYAVRACALGY